MTKENGNRLATVAYSEVKSQLGFLGDLPYELANSVTNVYWRFFEVGLDSELTFSAEEMDIRRRQFNAIAAAVTEVRRLKGKKLTNAADAIAFYYVNLEGVMNFFANKTVQCIYIQASSLGWHIKHEEQKRAIQLMSPMKNGRSAHPISR